MENLYNQTIKRERNDSQTLDKAITDCFVNDSQAVVAMRVLTYVVIMIASLIGNCVVIRLVKKEGRSRSSTSFYIANLAVCALFFTIVYMPRVISLFLRGYQWLVLGLPGVFLCKAVIFLDYLATSVSILTVMIISLERCVVVAFPYRSAYITTRLSKLMVLSTWLVGVFTQWPYLYSTDLVLKNGLVLCYIDYDRAFGIGAKQMYYNFSLIVIFFFPLAITTVAYTIIVVKLKRRKNVGDCACSISSGRERQNRQIIYMVLTVVTLFVLCWLLYFIFLVLYAYQIVVPCEVLFMRLFLAHLNSAITPYVYTKFSARYRRAFAAIIAPCCHCFCQKKLQELRGRAEESYRMQKVWQETSKEHFNTGCSKRR